MLLTMLLGCTKPPVFALDGAESGTLTAASGEEVTLNGADLTKLDTLISAQGGRKAVVTSKPDYVLTYSLNGKARTVSFFTGEGLIYPDEHTAAWGERMAGGKSLGAKLSGEVEAALSGAVGR